jgi:serine/threonine protein kinase
MIGKNILHYKIVGKLGEGGMGVVYKAEDTRLKRFVALKFLPHQVAINETERNRFEIEAQAAAALNHPNIATIHAIEEYQNELFIVMEYIEGKELRELIPPLTHPLPRGKIGGLGIDQLLNYATQIAEGLQAAHAKGIVHRDIKSSNIMITEDGKIKIMDFGLAKIGAGMHITKENTTIGTIAYMSPEQAKGDILDHRSDMWSYGVVLYELFTGKLPFRGHYDQAIIYSILNEEPEELEGNELPESVIFVIKKCLNKNPEERFKDMSEVVAALQTSEVPLAAAVNQVVDIKKLAVLPLHNLLNDPQTNFLGFALADQVIGAIAYTKNILVRPSSSIRKYQDGVVDIQKAGSELKVRYIVAGNYMKQADVIRLNVELVDLDTDKILWRETIQLTYDNIFELQDIVAQKVVTGLKVQFSDEERERMRPDIPLKPEAYEYYLRAIAYPQNLEGSTLAIEMLKNSLKLDPLYAHSYLELGIRYNQFSQVGEGAQAAFENAEKSLLKALSLKHDLLPALAYLALIYTDIGKHEEAHLLLMRALKINPNDPWIHFSLSYHYRYIGFLEESVKEAETAMSIDPGNPRFRSAVITYMFLGEYDKILSLNLDSKSPFSLNYLGETYYRMGKRDKANACFHEVLKHKEEVGEYYFAAAFIEYLQGNIEKALEYNLKREQANPADGEIWYEIARIYGLMNQKPACERALKKSVELGYLSYPVMEKDAFLDAVRDERGIRTVLDSAKAMHEELRERLSDAA